MVPHVPKTFFRKQCGEWKSVEKHMAEGMFYQDSLVDDEAIKKQERITRITHSKFAKIIEEQ